mmetsp:Transcript_17445/g.49058  ORF Transcript_17445/g.49058 Transcript_17445/m.49058 type:complete len:236 (-) Transcript_17445:61-768(-)
MRMRELVFIFSASSLTSLNSRVLRYRSPKDGMTRQIVLEAFSGRAATCSAACTAAPAEIPESRPSSVASLRAMAMASSLPTGITSSMTSRLSTSGTKPAPMPWILCGPGCPPESTGDSLGSTATTCTAGFIALRYSPHPVTVPPVPTPHTRMSTVPLESFQISGPVVRRCTSALAGLLNCCRMWAPSVAAAISSALATAPPIPLAGSVSTSSAPKARKSTRRSRDMEAGMVSTSR